MRHVPDCDEYHAHTPPRCCSESCPCRVLARDRVRAWDQDRAGGRVGALVDRWMAWMLRRGSAKMVDRDGGDYLQRYYLWELHHRRRRALPASGNLHVFLADDPDPPHDHPWPWGRLVVRGRYREHYHDGTHRDFGPWSFLWRREALALHRVELLTHYVVTLFWHWPRERTWGFVHADRGWVAAPDYGQDGRPKRGWIFPRKVGAPPREISHP